MTELESLANNQMGQLSKRLSAIFLTKLKEDASIYFMLRATDSFEPQETSHPNLEVFSVFCSSGVLHTLIICSIHQIQFLIRPESIRPTRGYVSDTMGVLSCSIWIGQELISRNTISA